MTWNPDAPGEMLDRASRVFWELCGAAPYLNWLEKEVSRTKVHLDYKKAVVFSASTAGGAREPQQPKPPLAATGAASIDPHLLNEMVDALRWYRDAATYVRDHAGQASIDLDCGERARAVLNKYDIEQMGT